MKLLIIYHHGLSREAKAFYREYAKQGIDLAVIVPSDMILQKTYLAFDGYSYSQKEDEKGYRFFPVDLRKPQSYGEGFKFFQLLKTIKKINPDVIHVFDEYSGLQLFQTVICRNFLYGKEVPIFSYAFQNISFAPPPFVFQFSTRFFKRIFRKILYPIVFACHNKYVSGVTGANEESLVNIRKVGFSGPVKKIFWGVDFKNFHPKPPADCRAKIGVPLGVKIVGYIGRFVKEKGIDKLIKAVNQIQNCRLMLVGGGDYQEDLKKLVSSLKMENKVYFFNNIPGEELKSYYNSFDVFVLPSETISQWKEQYGKVLAEAMACHVSIIGSSSGAIPEVLEGYPKSLIFKEGDVENLVKKIKEAENLRFPENFNLDRFLKKFSVENFVREHVKFYNATKT